MRRADITIFACSLEAVYTAIPVTVRSTGVHTALCQTRLDNRHFCIAMLRILYINDPSLKSEHPKSAIVDGYMKT